MYVYIVDTEKMANIIHICNKKKNGKCGDVRPSNLRPPFILGLRPKPGPIIAYEGNGISWQPKNLVENDFVLG